MAHQARKVSRVSTVFFTPRIFYPQTEGGTRPLRKLLGSQAARGKKYIMLTSSWFYLAASGKSYLEVNYTPGPQ
jgi:hypothetical protein